MGTILVLCSACQWQKIWMGTLDLLLARKECQENLRHGFK